ANRGRSVSLLQESQVSQMVRLFRANGKNYSVTADRPTMTAAVQQAPAVKLHPIARRLPEEIGAIFELLLPPVVWCGEGRPPASNHHWLPGLVLGLIPGNGWEYGAAWFPCGRTIKDRLQVWRGHDRFRQAWQQLAQRYEHLRGINGD